MLNESEIFSYFAHPTELPSVDKNHPFAKNYLQPAETPSGFVAPPLQMESQSAEMPDVILISAPAAVGKSWLARYLSDRTGNPFVDLSAFEVGSMHYSGLFAEVYGPTGFGEFIDLLRSGGVTLVIDSADEAHVRAGSGAFEESIVGLIRMFGESQKRSCAAAVILGRGDTIDDCFAQFELAGVSAVRWEVDYFDESGSREFVKQKIAADLGTQAIAELDGFLTDFFEHVLEAMRVNTFAEAKQFLGYAPVLDTLRDFYLSDPNPMRLLASVGQSTDLGHVWSLLSSVINYVCTRESDKFSRNFGGDDAAKAKFAGDVYSPKYQLELLLSDPDSLPDPEIADEADISWLDDLTDKIEQQLKIHPFKTADRAIARRSVFNSPLNDFANPAFRDYALAWGFMNLDSGAVKSLAASASRIDFNPTPMLSRFIFLDELHPANSVVSPEIIGPLIDSLSSALGESSTQMLLQEDDEDYLVASLVGDRSASNGSFLKIRADNDIFLGRRAANISVDLPNHRVVAGFGQAEFTLGPNAQIQCETFSSESKEVRVRYPDSKGSSILVVSQMTGSTQQVFSPAPNALRIISTTLGYPWRRFAERSADGEAGNDFDWNDIYYAGSQLRRLTSWFLRASAGRGGLQYPSNAMDIIVRKGRASAEMFNFCRDEGYLTRTADNIYVLDFPFSVPVIVSVGIGRSEEYVAFLRKFLAWKDRTAVSDSR